MNQPFIKFFVRDWQADPELRMCSLEARGFWFECLCLMHNAARKGFLEAPNGIKYEDDDIAKIIGTFKGDVYRCKQELLKHGIPSVEEETGVWYCRRMVKEEAKAIKCANAGKKGGGSPLIKEVINNTRYHISLKVTFKGQEYENAFEAFWSIYPRKVAKAYAKQKFWAKVPTFPTNPEDLLNAVERAKESEQWQKDNGKFIPHPSTWINGERWTDMFEQIQSTDPIQEQINRARGKL